MTGHYCPLTYNTFVGTVMLLGVALMAASLFRPSAPAAVAPAVQPERVRWVATNLLLPAYEELLGDFESLITYRISQDPRHPFVPSAVLYLERFRTGAAQLKYVLDLKNLRHLEFRKEILDCYRLYAELQMALLQAFPEEIDPSEPARLWDRSGRLERELRDATNGSHVVSQASEYVDNLRIRLEPFTGRTPS